MDYRTQVMSLNIGPLVQQYMAYKVGAEMDATLLCAMSKEIIKVPVRHRGFTNIRCIFELDSWVEYYKSKNGQDFSNCPGCRVSVKANDYGVDYTLYHAIAMLNLVDTKNEYRRDRMATMYSQYKFYAISKKDSSIKMLLPGCIAVLNVQRRSQQSAKVQFNQNNQNTQEEISRTIEKLEQYLKKKKYEAIAINNKDLNKINNNFSSKAAAVKQAIIQNCKLVEIGKKSITTDDFVFALKKINRPNQTSSMLVIYYPHYNIWLDFELFNQNGQPYIQLEQALYIKNSSQKDFNIIYIIGGQTAIYKQSAQFLQIEVPKDPFTKVLKLTLKQLPDLLQIGYNYLGTFYEGKVFIFYGQKRYINQHQYITDELLNSAQVFKNNKWSTLNLSPVSRFDGSYFVITHQQLGRCLIFYGGVPGKPDGLENCACKQQKEGQIFICKEESFFGGPDKTFELKFPLMPNGSNQDRGLSTPIFSIPFFNFKQLLISGDYLKENLNGKRQIYTFDWGEGIVTLNEIFSLEPPEQILTPQKDKYQFDKEIFTPVQDCEGCVIYGTFYTIHQYEEQQGQKSKSTTQLLSINKTNGLFKILPYQDRTNGQEICRTKLQTLKDTTNIVTYIKN